jgi:hypothetical protein
MLRLVLLRLLESYFRHRWLNLLPILLMAGLGAFFVTTAKPKYIAEGVLYVQNESLLASLTAVRNNNTAWWITPAQATMNELGELLQTKAFVRAIIQQTDLEEEMDGGVTAVEHLLSQTRTNIWTYPLGDNQLRISASHTEPQVAFQLVHAAIERYIQWQVNAQRAENEAAQAFFSSLIDTYGIELGAAREEMKRYLQTQPEPIRGERTGIEQLEITRLQSAITLAEARYASALDKEENTRLALAQIESNARQTYLLIDAPRLPETPATSIRQTAINFGIFLAAGVVLSLSAIVGAALLDRSFRLPIDVEHRLDLPVWGIVPDISSPRKRWFALRRRQREITAVPGNTQPAAEPALPLQTHAKHRAENPDPVI